MFHLSISYISITITVIIIVTTISANIIIRIYALGLVSCKDNYCLIGKHKHWKSTFTVNTSLLYSFETVITPLSFKIFLWPYGFWVFWVILSDHHTSFHFMTLFINGDRKEKCVCLTSRRPLRNIGPDSILYDNRGKEVSYCFFKEVKIIIAMSMEKS